MMILSANTFVQSMNEQKSKRRRLHNLRDFLLTSLRINPHSQDLVVAVGDGHERNNAEALMHWLTGASQQDPSLPQLPAKEVESRLMRHLGRMLDCWPE